MAKSYDAAEREQIRTALIAYMRQHKAGTPKLEKLTRVPARTIHRFITGKWVNALAVHMIAGFLDRLPARPTAQIAFAEAFYNFFNHTPDFIGGVYRVTAADTPLSELTINFPQNSRTSYIATERTTGRFPRNYDGSLIFTGKGIIAVLKDRLMLTGRLYMLHLNKETKRFYGLVYDDGPLESGALPYQLHQIALERIADAP